MRIFSKGLANRRAAHNLAPMSTPDKSAGVTISLNNGRLIHAPAGRSLFAALRSNGILVPTACGGKGACGLCKVRVRGDSPPLQPAELSSLSGGELADNVRLSCQVKPVNDICVELSTDVLAAREFKATVESILNLTHDIKEVRLALLPPGAISFRPGQFIVLRIPPYASSRFAAFRPFSLASSPARPDRLELQIRRVRGGIGTTYVFDHLSPGASLSLTGPYGDFWLRKSGRDVIFIAGGSGMAPILSIIEDMADRGISRKAVFFFGARAREDLFHLDRIASLQKRLPELRFVPALSAPAAGDDWDGERGLITEVLERNVRSVADAEAYLCGSPAMINACVGLLQRKGLCESRIFYDKFTSYRL